MHHPGSWGSLCTIPSTVLYRTPSTHSSRTLPSSSLSRNTNQQQSQCWFAKIQHHKCIIGVVLWRLKKPVLVSSPRKTFAMHLFCCSVVIIKEIFFKVLWLFQYFSLFWCPECFRSLTTNVPFKEGSSYGVQKDFHKKNWSWASSCWERTSSILSSE